MRLDADSAFEPVTPTRRQEEVTDRRWVVGGPFGGCVAASAARAPVAAADDPARRPRSRTIHDVGASAAGPVEVCAAVERVGCSSTAASLWLEQDGPEMALVRS